MLARYSFLALGASLALASVTSGGSAATSPNAIPSMIPLLEVTRDPSPDGAFVKRAIALAIATMDSSNREISLANTVQVQDEAVRAFNTAAETYNALADLAAKREMKIAKPKASTLDETPALAQDAMPGAQDVAFVIGSQSSLEAAVALYHAEIQHGKDPLAVALAKHFRTRFDGDLELVRIDIENIDHPKPTPTLPPPDPVPSDVPSASPNPSPSA